jgi:hypothetical protein
LTHCSLLRRPASTGSWLCAASLDADDPLPASVPVIVAPDPFQLSPDPEATTAAAERLRANGTDQRT